TMWDPISCSPFGRDATTRAKVLSTTEYKLETFAGVYRKFCGKNEVFEYPLSEAS
ncbi:hypothetical protein SUGI_1296800, partial [Cryptomeria japonica]